MKPSVHAIMDTVPCATSTTGTGDPALERAISDAANMIERVAAWRAANPGLDPYESIREEVGAEVRAMIAEAYRTALREWLASIEFTGLAD